MKNETKLINNSSIIDYTSCKIDANYDEQEKEKYEILQNKLISKLVILATIFKNHPELATSENKQFLTTSLAAITRNIKFDQKILQNWIDLASQTINKTGITNENYFDFSNLAFEGEGIYSLKTLVISGIKGLSTYNYRANQLGYFDDEVDNFIIDGLSSIQKSFIVEELLIYLLQVGKANYLATRLFSKAKHETYGHPLPTNVKTKVLPGPFIVASGHNLSDFHALLKQTIDQGINIYTCGELLTGHAFPMMNDFLHLKGHYGSGVSVQSKAFVDVPGAFVFTTNCTLPETNGDEKNLFSTSTIAYEGFENITNQDFSNVIEKALDLGGYDDWEINFNSANDVIKTGFRKQFLIDRTKEIVDHIKEKKISHIFIILGCDNGENKTKYYKNFIKEAPKDALIINLACGKYQFINNDEIDMISDIPRIIDIGQCNDAYSAIEFAIELAKEMECDINELPLTFLLSWWEHKSGASLLTLLYFGVKNFYLGPNVPDFISSDALFFLTNTYKIKPITNPQNDLEAILGK